MSDDVFADHSSDGHLGSGSESGSYECSEYPRCDWGSSCIGNHSYSHWRDSSIDEKEQQCATIKGDGVVDKPPCKLPQVVGCDDVVDGIFRGDGQKLVDGDGEKSVDGDGEELVAADGIVEKSMDSDGVCNGSNEDEGDSGCESTAASCN